jgi:hypothetical protein
MDESEFEPADDVSLKTVLDAVNRQSKNIEAIVEAKANENIGVLRDEIRGTTQSMKSHMKTLKSDAQYKWRSEGNTIQFNSNTENMEDLTQSLWAIDNTKIDYARDLIIACIERLKHRNKLIKIADTSDGGWDTARQYEANPIASDPNDESKIIRAENRAIRKKKSKNKSSGPMSSCNTAAIQPAGYSYVPPMPPFRGFQQPWYAGFPFTQDAYAGKIQRGPCYACGSVKR